MIFTHKEPSFKLLMSPLKKKNPPELIMLSRGLAGMRQLVYMPFS